MRDAVLVRNDAALAAYMGISPKTISNWKQRGSIPEEYTREFAERTGESLDWLVLGRQGAANKPRSTAEERTSYVIGPEDVVFIPHYDVSASAGLGKENGDAPPTKRNYFRREWWQQHIGLPVDQCFSMDITGDSMAPRITEAHTPIVHRVHGNEILTDAIFVFRLDGEVFIKHLERVPGRGIVARSENKEFTPWEIGDGSTFGEFKIIGRVIRKQSIELP